MGISLLGAQHIRKGQAVRIRRPRKYLASPVAFAGTKFGVLRQWQRDLCPLKTMYNQQLTLLLSPQKRNTPLSAARCDAPRVLVCGFQNNQAVLVWPQLAC